jgi:hypothetical protein
MRGDIDPYLVACQRRYLYTALCLVDRTDLAARAFDSHRCHVLI